MNSYQEPLKGKRVGVVFGSFAPLHQGHLDLIMRAKKENDGGAIVIVCGRDGDKGDPCNIPHSKRYRYVREFFSDDPLVAVYGIDETALKIDEYPNGWTKWMTAFQHIYEKATYQAPSLVWYVGDQNYYDDLSNDWGETAVLVDRTADNPISATMIRQNPIKHWNKITHPFKRVFSTNILITGTASEGKTTLVADLAKYFDAPHSTEFARDYMNKYCVDECELDCADFLAFLEGQYNSNREMIDSPGNKGIFFADTDSLVTNMYARAYAEDNGCMMSPEDYEKVKLLSYQYAKKCRWDKIFLLMPGGTFVDDHVRYMGCSDISERRKMFDGLVDSIEEVGDWDKVVILNGSYYENFITIANYVKEIIENGKD